MVAVDSFVMDETMRRAFEKRAARLWPFQAAGSHGTTFVKCIDGEVLRV
jgi:hypothetical protein